VQAKIVHDFIEDILCANPGAFAAALGDLNEFTAFPPLQARALARSSCCALRIVKLSLTTLPRSARRPQRVRR
jgi:hypothetical protein